jgi:flagellin-like protein
MNRQNKAISPIFATLIILAVVTVLFIPVFIWATGTSSETEDFWESTGLVTTERIVVEEVSLKSGQTDCTVYVRNIGKTAVTITDVLIVAPGNTYIYEQSKGEFLSQDPVTDSPLNSITQGELIEIQIADLKGLNVGYETVYTVKVFTDHGVGGEYEINATD